VCREAKYRRIASVIGRILPGLLCPRGIARCGHYRQRYLRSLAMRIRRRAVYRTVDVVLKDGGFVDSREVAIINEPLFICVSFRTYPLVKTFNSDVFPQAPSPLNQISAMPSIPHRM